jgi:hypothetical protein
MTQLEFQMSLPSHIIAVPSKGREVFNSGQRLETRHQAESDLGTIAETHRGGALHRNSQEDIRRENSHADVERVTHIVQRGVRIVEAALPRTRDDTL